MDRGHAHIEPAREAQYNRPVAGLNSLVEPRYAGFLRLPESQRSSKRLTRLREPSSGTLEVRELEFTFLAVDSHDSRTRSRPLFCLMRSIPPASSGVCTRRRVGCPRAAARLEARRAIGATRRGREPAGRHDDTRRRGSHEGRPPFLRVSQIAALCLFWRSEIATADQRINPAVCVGNLMKTKPNRNRRWLTASRHAIASFKCPTGAEAGFLDLHVVDGAIRATGIVFDNLEHSGASESLKHLRCIMLIAGLSKRQCVTEESPHIGRQPHQVPVAATYPFVMPANLATHDSPPGSMAAPAVRRRWPYLRTSVEVFQFELQN